MPDKNILVINGEDNFILRIRLDALVSRYIPPEMREFAFLKFFGGEVSEEELLSEVATPAFGCEHKLIVLYKYNRIRNKKMLVRLVDSCPDSCLLVMCQEETRASSTAFDKHIKSRPNIELVTCFPPDSRELSGRINRYFKDRNKKIDPQAALFLSEHFLDESQNLLAELEKIDLYFSGDNAEKMINEEAVSRLVSSGGMVSHFDVISHIVKRNKKLSLVSLQKYLKLTGDLVTLQALLFNETQRLIRYHESLKQGMAEDDIWQAMGVYYHKARTSIKEAASVFKLDLLYEFALRLSELERILKTEHVGASGGAGSVSNRINPLGRVWLEKMILTYCI